MKLGFCLPILILFTGSRDAASMRKTLSDERQNLDVGKPPLETADGGTFCLDLKDMGKYNKGLGSFLHKYDLETEFEELKTALQKAPGAWHGGYKGSSLSRTMLKGGHDASFEKKSIKLTLLRAQHTFYKSTFRLCMTSASKLPASELEAPFKIYGDGFSVVIDCQGRTKWMTPGAVAQKTSDGIHENNGIRSLQVETLRLLMKKQAENLQRDFERDLAKGPEHSRALDTRAWPELVAQSYREPFRKLGIGLFYNRHLSRCCCGRHCQKCTFSNQWFEYVDLDILPDYKPKLKHPVDISWLKNYVRCSAEDSDVRKMMGLSAVSLESRPNGKCVVEGAEPRQKPDTTADCKCPHHSKVYCDSREISDRKFSSQEIAQQCKDPYCSANQCPFGLP